MRTTFSVAIPTHDRRDLTLLSLQSILGQTREPLEVMVLCDGCVDDTPEAVRALGDPRVEVLELPKGHGYGYAHRTLSLERAKGDVMLWVSDDDLLLPDHLEVIGAQWDAGGLDIVHAGVVPVTPDGRYLEAGMDWNEPFYRDMLERHISRSPMSSLSFRAEAARAVGGWNAELAGHGDQDLVRRMLSSGARSALVLQPTVLYFQAAGRPQTREERLAQNRAYFERLGDPVKLRREIATGLAASRAAWEADYVGREGYINELEERLRAVPKPEPQPLPQPQRRRWLRRSGGAA